MWDNLSRLSEPDIITHTDRDQGGYDVQLRLFLCLFVCLLDRSITQKLMIPECSLLLLLLLLLPINFGILSWEGTCDHCAVFVCLCVCLCTEYLKTLLKDF